MERSNISSTGWGGVKEIWLASFFGVQDVLRRCWLSLKKLNDVWLRTQMCRYKWCSLLDFLHTTFVYIYFAEAGSVKASCFPAKQASCFILTPERLPS